MTSQALILPDTPGIPADEMLAAAPVVQDLITAAAPTRLALQIPILQVKRKSPDYAGGEDQEPPLKK